jgi:hypothetical protein
MQANIDRNATKTVNSRKSPNGIIQAVNPEHAELISMASQLNVYAGALNHSILTLQDWQTTQEAFKLAHGALRELKRCYNAAIYKGYINVDDFPAPYNEVG